MATAVSAAAATAFAACGSGGAADSPQSEKLKELIAKSSTSATVETDRGRPRAAGPVIVALPTGGFGGSQIAVQIEAVVADIRQEQGDEANLDHALISVQPQSGAQGLVDAITAARDEGRQLDLVFINSRSELEALDDAGLLTAVQSAATSDPTFELSNYFQSALDAASIQGQPMAMPVWIRPTMVQYSPGVFEAAGIEPPNASWDWPTFVERATRLTVPGANGGRSQYGFIVFPFITPSYMFMWQNRADVISPDGKILIVNSPEAIEAVQFMADLVLKHEVSPRLIGDEAEALSINITDDGLVVNGGLIAMLPRQIGGQFGFHIFRALFAGVGGGDGGGGGGGRGRGARVAPQAASPGLRGGSDRGLFQTSTRAHATRQGGGQCWRNRRNDWSSRRRRRCPGRMERTSEAGRGPGAPRSRPRATHEPRSLSSSRQFARHRKRGRPDRRRRYFRVPAFRGTRESSRF